LIRWATPLHTLMVGSRRWNLHPFPTLKFTIKIFYENLISKYLLNSNEGICLSWKILEEDALSKIKKQKEFEDQTAKKLTPLYESAKNPIIKLFIHSLILDTMRHSDTYQMLLDLNSSAQMGDESKDFGQRELKIHIKEEAQMLKQTKDISEVVKDKKIKQLILNILEDEQKHHRVLEEVLEILNKESREWDAYLYDLITGFP
jgi:rubrerythrin